MDAHPEETPRPGSTSGDVAPPDEADRDGALGPDREPGAPPFVVVGLGASAGGLEALEAFFAGLPRTDGAAFVVVIHLAPDQESRMAEVLDRSVPIPVTQVTERVEVEPGHVYVIPPNRNLVMEDGHLRLAPLESERAERRPIDHFFRTLAEAYGPRAVGVVLSGTGQNGTVGVRRIRELGGLILAQDPEDAAFDEMPRSALASGIVDHLAPAAALGREVIDYADRLHETRLPDGDEVPPDDVRTVQRILSLLKSRTGHDFAHYKRSTVLRRLARRVHVVGADGLAGYLEHLRRRPTEAEALLDDLLISVTNFFRDREAFEALEETVVPRLFEGKRSADEVRVWVAGCATGEEAYSVAILLAEHAAALPDSPAVQVFATDLSEGAIRTARAGVYPESVEADVSPERLRRFFRRVQGGYQVTPALRETVLFAPHSLLKDPPFARLDLVTCRNLLIYLQRDLQRRVLELFHYVLRPGGTLFLGTSETAEAAGTLYRAEDKPARLYRRRDAQTALPDLPRARRVSLVPLAEVPPSAETEPADEPPSFADLHNLSRAAAAPPSVLVTAERDVVHVSEGAGPFLRMGEGSPSQNVLRLVLAPLRPAVQAALYGARRSGEAAATGPVRVEVEGEARAVTVRAVPVGESDLFAVAFESAALPAPARPPGEAADALGAELQKTQEQLQLSLEEFETSREELKAQNEELQSVNEELRSTAEELETAKEEAQSMAEELQTANDELKAKVDALAEATGDLENLVVSTEIATLFLDRELRIKWFTPHVRRHFRIRDSDLGRPLADLAPRFGGGPLVEDAEAVLDRLQVTEREVRGDDGRWYLVHVRPYRSVTDRIEGVVVTFVDITERRGGEEALHESEEQFRALVTASAEIVWTADAEGRLVEDSPTWRAFTGQTYDEWKGEGGFDVVHPDDRDEARAAYGAAVEAGERFEHDLRLWHTATRTWRWTHVRAVPLRDDAGAVRGYVGMNTDVTERRVAEETLRQSEARARFRAALAERFRALTDPAEVQRAAAQALGEHLGASRAHYAEVEPDGEHAVVVCDYARGVPDRAGRHALADFLTLHDEARAGRTFVVADVQAEDGLSPEEKAVFAGLPVAALVVAPVVRRARFVAALAVHHAAPHAWSPAEVALVEETAERTWEAVERTRAEAALRESEARYRTLFASMTEGFCVLEMVYDEAGRAVDYRFVEANPAFERHTGLEDPVGRTARDLIPGLEDHWVETYARVAETGEPERFEQGSAAMGRLFEVEAFRVGGEGGRVGLLFADVTERAAAADALRQSEERFRQAVDAAGLGTWSYDVGEELTHFDARAREIFGVGAEALPSDAVVALVHPDDLAAFAAARDRALAPDTPDTFAETHRVVRPDGEVRWVRGQARAFFEGEGPGRRPVRAVGVVLDVTEQRAGEAALRESEERFRRTAETVPDVLFIAAGDGRLRYVNPRFEEVTGVPAEDAVGADLWAEIVHPEDRAPAGPGGAAPGPYELRHRLRTADGSYRWHLTRAQPVLDAGGRVEAWYGTSTDIDRMVRAEEEVQSLNATLERRVRQRTALARRLLARLTTAEEEERKRIAQVLHDDLQQRLYGLSMTLALVRRQSDAGAPDPAVLDRAEATLAEAAALTRTLSTELAPAVLNAADLDETLEWLAEHARAQYGLDVEVAVAPGSGVADRDARVVLYQILRELLFNVVKHAGTGRARVRVRPADDAVAVTVEDEGVGFDPAVLDDAAGTGLGLASAQGRLDLVGGRVRVDAAPGRGTRVTVWVPRRVYASEEP